jgi:hypothetical protein
LIVEHSQKYGDTVIAKGCTDMSFIRLDDGTEGPCGLMFGDRVNQELGYNLTYFVPLCLCEDADMCNANNSACFYSPDNCIDPIPWENEPCRRRRTWPEDWCTRKGFTMVAPSSSGRINNSLFDRHQAALWFQMTFLFCHMSLMAAYSRLLPFDID